MYHNSRRKFQLAFLTCLVIALKCRAGMQVDSPFVSETICQGMYSPTEIVHMEQVVLEALEWRLNGPSPQEFIDALLQLLPLSTTTSTSSTSNNSSSSRGNSNKTESSSNQQQVLLADRLKSLACTHVESSMLDPTMALQPPSRIAYAALLVAMSKLSSSSPQDSSCSNTEEEALSFSPSERYAWISTIALVSGMTTSTTRRAANTSTITTRENHTATTTDRRRRQRQYRGEEDRDGDIFSSSSTLSSSSSSYGYYYYPTNHHGNLIDDYDMSDYDMGGSSISGGSRRSSGGGDTVYATPDRRGGGSRRRMMDPPTSSSSSSSEEVMFTEFYCTPVGVVGVQPQGSSSRYCTPISNSSYPTTTRRRQQQQQWEC